jgi:cell division topological specificity factor
MNILKLIRMKKKQSASVAKERLSIIISHERAKQSQPDFLPDLRRELIGVIAKYVELDEEQINIQMKRQDNYSTIEMNIVLPEMETA